MPDAKVVEWIREKLIDLADELDERGRRRWSAIEARSLGRGGVAAVAEATGISDRTIRTGIQEHGLSHCTVEPRLEPSPQRPEKSR